MCVATKSVEFRTLEREAFLLSRKLVARNTPPLNMCIVYRLPTRVRSVRPSDNDSDSTVIHVVCLDAVTETGSINCRTHNPSAGKCCPLVPLSNKPSLTCLTRTAPPLTNPFKPTAVHR